MKRFLTIFCLVAFLGVSQSYGNFYNHFLHSNGGLPYKVLLAFAHPTNRFDSAYCYVKTLDRGLDYMIITIWSTERSLFGGGEHHKTVFNLYVTKDNIRKLKSIKVVSDTDDCAFCVAQTISKAANILLKVLMDNLHVSSKYLDEILDFMKRKISENINKKIEAETLCVTSLQYMLTKYRETNDEFDF